MNPAWNLGLLAWLLGHFAMAAYDARWSLMAWQVVYARPCPAASSCEDRASGSGIDTRAVVLYGGILLALTANARLAQYKRWRGLA